MRKGHPCLPRLNALAFASALGAVSALACAETVVNCVQATGSYVLEVNTAASALDSQLLPAASSSDHPVFFTSAGFSAVVTRTDEPTRGDFSVSSVSESTDMDIQNVGQFMALSDEIEGFAEGGSFAAFERIVLERAFALSAQWLDDAALFLTTASRFAAPLEFTDVSVANVPEPSTYALMFGSMSIISSTARRRRNDAVGWMASRRREDVAA
jgi:hypothetical protein